MTTLHAASGELINIRPFGDTLPQATSATLVKTDQLELLRLVLPAGNKLPQHHVASVITVQCIEGAVEFELMGARGFCAQGPCYFWRPENHTRSKQSRTLLF